MKKRYELSAELGEFVAVVNDELSALREPASADASNDFVYEINGRRKIMEHEVRVALYHTSVSAFLLQILSVTLNQWLLIPRRPRFRVNISRHTPPLTGSGFLYL